jgi:hypothetical protein
LNPEILTSRRLDVLSSLHKMFERRTIILEENVSLSEFVTASSARSSRVTVN